MRSGVLTSRARALALATVTLATACAAPAGPAAATPRSTQAVAATPGAPAATTVPTASARAAARPAFLSHRFTDVRDGKAFTLSEFAGRPVLVIGMAVW